MNFTKLALSLTLTWGCASALAAPPPLPGQPPQAPRPQQQAGDEAALPTPSSSAQKLYSSAKADLLQVRSLLKSGRTQSSVGSGFLVGTSNLVLTNYHVVSQFALDPETYIGEWVDTAGQRGNIELLAVDVLHDLAVVRVNRYGTGVFSVPEKPVQLSQGQYLYSLGNPLDLGFAISEGAYNGVITRSFYDQLLFTGPINAGMSGGPSVTANGEVVGVNVSKRLDGELVSFLVPARYAQELLKKVTPDLKPPKDFTAVVAQQLLAHQKAMIDQLFSTPLTMKAMGPYEVPVRESEQMRCWGRSNVRGDKPFSVDITNCSMESAIFVSGSLQTGAVSIQHQYMRSAGLDPIRFAQLSSASFKNEAFGSHRDSRLTGPTCTEEFIRNDTLPMRAVLCVKAYRKFEGLYDFSLLIGSTDDSMMNLQSRMDARGVSYENGMRASRAFLKSVARGGKK
ncbi:serine protease [Pseudoduganella sp. UC29_106]|uniref:S1 family peptidase n=1 Tax=Pseudoduganella sp. UC29_106 TaxID=3374553 RepID=UPI0037580758